MRSQSIVDFTRTFFVNSYRRRQTKFAFVRVEIIRAEINASNYITVPTSLSLERTPEFILKLPLAFVSNLCVIIVAITLQVTGF